MTPVANGCQRHRWCTLSCEYLREFSKKFEMALKEYSGAWGKLIYEKNQKSKISWHCPFNLYQIIYSTYSVIYIYRLTKYCINIFRWGNLKGTKNRISMLFPPPWTGKGGRWIRNILLLSKQGTSICDFQGGGGEWVGKGGPKGGGNVCVCLGERKIPWLYCTGDIWLWTPFLSYI